MTEASLTNPDTSSAPDEPLPKNNTLRYSILIAFAVFLVGLIFVFAGSFTKKESPGLAGSEAPPFALTTFEGEPISLAELKGQIVVMNFWASWCVECYDEAPLLEQAYQDYKDKDVIFVGVAYLDTIDEAKEYMFKYGITYPSGMDVGTVLAKDYFITGVPETFFIDEDGVIQHVQIGPIQTPQLYGLLDKLIAQRATASTSQ